MPLRDSIKDGPVERALRVAEPVLPLTSREGEQMQLDELTQQVGNFISRQAADHKHEAALRHRKIEKTLASIFPKEAIAVARETLLGEKSEQPSRMFSAMDGPMTARPPTSSQGAIPRTPNTGRTSSTPAAFRLPAFRRPPTVEPREGRASPPVPIGLRNVRGVVTVTPTLQHQQMRKESAGYGAGSPTNAVPSPWQPNLTALRKFSESQFASLQRWAESSFNDALLFDEKQRIRNSSGPTGSAKAFVESHHVPSKLIVSSVCFILDEVMSTVTGFDTLWPKLRDVLYHAIYVEEKLSRAVGAESSSRGCGTAGDDGILRDTAEGTFHGEAPCSLSSPVVPIVVYDSHRQVPPSPQHPTPAPRTATRDGDHGRVDTTSRRQVRPQAGSGSQLDFRHMLSGAPMISEKCSELFREIDRLKDEVEAFRAIHDKQLRISDMTVRSSGRVIVQMMFTAWRAVVTRRKQRESSVNSFAVSHQESAMKAIAFLRWRRYIVQLQRNRLRDANANATSAAQMQAEEQLSAVQTLEVKLANAQRQHRLDLAREEEMRKTLIANHKIEVMEMRTVQDQKDDIILMQEKNCRRWERVAKLHRSGVRVAPPKALISAARKLRDIEEELFHHGPSKSRIANARGLLERFLISWVNSELESSKSRIKSISNTFADLRDGDVYIALARALRKGQVSLVKTAGDMDPFATLLTILYVNTAQGLFPPLLMHCGFYMKFFTPDHIGMVAHPLGGLWILSTLFVAKALQTGSAAFVPALDLSQPDAHLTPPYYLALMDGVRYIQEQREALAQQRAEEGNNGAGGSRKSTVAPAHRRAVTPPKSAPTQKTMITAVPSISPPKPKGLVPPGGPMRALSPSVDTGEEGEWSDDSSDNDAYFGSKSDRESSTSSSDEGEVTVVASVNRLSFAPDGKTPRDSTSEKKKGRRRSSTGSVQMDAPRRLPPCPKELVGLGIRNLVEMLTSEEAINAKWCGLARTVTSLILRYRILDLDGKANNPTAELGGPAAAGGPRGSIGGSGELLASTQRSTATTAQDPSSLSRRASAVVAPLESDTPLNISSGGEGPAQQRRSSSVKFMASPTEL